MGEPVRGGYAGAPPKHARSVIGRLTRLALRQNGQHPELTFRNDALLCSINERLGALLPAGAEAGEEFGPLGWDWLHELGPMAAVDAEELPGANPPDD